MIVRQTILGAFVTFLTLLTLLPAASMADGGLGFTRLDSSVQRALQSAIGARHLEELGLASVAEVTRHTTVEITLSDCPRTCNAQVDRGLCYCAPDGGGCKTGTSPATLSGAAMCGGLPDTATLFASEGGLGTTRVSLSR